MKLNQELRLPRLRNLRRGPGNLLKVQIAVTAMETGRTATRRKRSLANGPGGTPQGGSSGTKRRKPDEYDISGGDGDGDPHDDPWYYGEYYEGEYGGEEEEQEFDPLVSSSSSSSSEGSPNVPLSPSPKPKDSPPTHTH